MFSEGGALTDAEWSTLLADVAERVDIAQAVAKVFDGIWSQQSSKVPVDAGALYWLLQQQVEIERINGA
jgi:hypothetical protein